MVVPAHRQRCELLAIAHQRGHPVAQPEQTRPGHPPRVLRQRPGRLLGRTRALILAALDQPLSTTALAAATELSPAGVSRHLLALRDAGLLTTARHGHEIRYRRTELGSALLHARRR